MKLHKSARRSGSSAVELAITLPLLTFVFAIGVDFTRIFYYSQIVENSARNGAIYASDPKAPAANLYSSISQAALADAADLSPAPTITSASGTDAAGNATIAVTSTWSFGSIMNYAGVPKTVSLSRTVTMRVAPQ